MNEQQPLATNPTDVRVVEVHWSSAYLNMPVEHQRPEAKMKLPEKITKALEELERDGYELLDIRFTATATETENLLGEEINTAYLIGRKRQN